MLAIEAEGYDTTTMLIVTNTAQFLDVIPVAPDKIGREDDCLRVVF